MAQRVTCISKRGNHYDPHERIARIGGSGWKLDEPAAIDRVKADLNAYSVETPEGTVFLIVRRHNGRNYLTTFADGTLLSGTFLRPCTVRP
jgi:hypothetical protein